ncbi:MAG: BolA family transcriptional regulator [Gammaproteobacteria bacterium]|nr:MAG: BolA family transcriptional regulator [Gammaproteobacteria bacterium]
MNTAGANTTNVNSTRIEAIKQLLTEALSPEYLEIIDESYQHAGHAGAKSGKGHFDAIIVSTAFAGKNPLQRHRMVYDALGNLMHTDIHALSIKARTPDENQ